MVNNYNVAQIRADVAEGIRVGNSRISPLKTGGTLAHTGEKVPSHNYQDSHLPTKIF
jgi:hypothetical protein